MTERKLPEWMVKLKSNTKLCRDPNKSVTPEKIPILTFQGEIRYSNNLGDCGYFSEAVLRKLESQTRLVVGFDLEWPLQWVKGGGQGKASLLQLCLDTQVCYLFQVSEWEHLPKIFIDFISHPKVRLVGLKVQGDIWKLGRDFDLSVMPIIKHNVVELNHLANKTFSTRENWSLDRLVLYVLKKRLDKPDSVRTSNWAVESLTAQHMKYAATDAYASLLVYQRLKDIETEIHNDNSCVVQSAS